MFCTTSTVAVTVTLRTGVSLIQHFLMCRQLIFCLYFCLLNYLIVSSFCFVYFYHIGLGLCGDFLFYLLIHDAVNSSEFGLDVEDYLIGTWFQVSVIWIFLLTMLAKLAWKERYVVLLKATVLCSFLWRAYLDSTRMP